jgi:hypothetical protein
MPNCKHCKHAKRWLASGTIVVECLAKGEMGYPWNVEFECEEFEKKSLKEPSVNNVRVVKHGSHRKQKATGSNFGC